jgi:hypothetical protein
MEHFSEYLKECDRIQEMSDVVCACWESWGIGYRQGLAHELSKHDSTFRKKFWIAITEARGSRFKNEIHSFCEMCWMSAGIGDIGRV